MPVAADPAAPASYITALMQGMAVKATSGATRKELREIATMALRAWPD